MDSATLEWQLRDMLDDMSARIYDRDMSIVEKFWSGGKFWLFGSEEHEHDETEDELRRHMASLFGKPYRARFVFGTLSVDRHGDMAWVNAPAVLEIIHPDRTAQLAYRLFALFQNIGGTWHWRVFSGSEPAAPPP